jgi:hypothetical protein
MLPVVCLRNSSHCIIFAGGWRRMILLVFQIMLLQGAAADPLHPRARALPLEPKLMLIPIERLARMPWLW